MKDVMMVIDGKCVSAGSGKQFERRSPLDNQVASRAPAASAADARSAVRAASGAFAAWSSTGPTEKRSLLIRAAAALEARAEAFVITMQAEIGASSAWAHFNVRLAADGLREAAAITTQIHGEIIPSDLPNNLAFAIRQPAGVVLGIAPWNAPVILGTRAVALPLACGNTVVLKGSEICPATHELIIDAMLDAGFPRGVINFVTNAPEDAAEIVEAIVSDQAVRRVNFTGSTRVGKLVAALCGKHLKRAVLELGGKAPFIVLDDADLDEAVNAAAFGCFANSGQICMSTERIIVAKGIADEFVQKLAEKAKGLPVGDPRFTSVVLGSVVDTSTVERCNRLIEDALSKGATLVCGGISTSTLMPATLLDHVTSGMDIYGTESFGPVKAIVRVDSDEAAVNCANDNEYGLSSSVFSQNLARAMNVARRLEAGICHVNGSTVHDEAQMPFGGMKSSGFGHFGGKAGIAEFTDLRWLTIQTASRAYPF
ncbi:aldehyde dehydrogenase [Burkholderia sp. S171]|uniref:aldehyde dehydrogenase n=1 Tax=Burkholderia sp. S171 TaxID=1641860 RepID=UPI00131DDB76|nr:aldehyde dehydrogenase [Burkholderia sp. S171]